MEIFRHCSLTLLKFRKLHLLKHWGFFIRRYGAPYLFSNEKNEEFHKTAAKVSACTHRVHSSLKGSGCSYFKVTYYLNVSDAIKVWFDFFMPQIPYRLSNRVTPLAQMFDSVVRYDAMNVYVRSHPVLLQRQKKLRRVTKGCRFDCFNMRSKWKTVLYLEDVVPRDG